MHKSEWLFPKDLAEAAKAQREMADSVILENRFDGPIRTLAGVDVSNTPFDLQQKIFGAAVLFSYPELSLLETATKIERQEFPYIPGMLGFREVPVLMRVCAQLSVRPGLLLVDGHGISHPRGLGVASHLGVLLDLPTIGVAKSILVGSPAGPLAPEPGSRVPLIWKGKEIGAILRTKKKCSPLIISTGHKITLNTAVEWVIRCLCNYRLPEPTRHAHLAANQARKTEELCAPTF